MGLNTHELELIKIDLMGMEMENKTPEEIIKKYKELAEEKKRYFAIEESTRAERIKRYGDIDKDWEGELDESFIELMKLMNEENKNGNKAVLKDLACKEIACKYKELTGRDITEDLN